MMARALGLLMVMALLVGCGSGDSVRQYNISGSVKFNGQPVKYGRIIFDPDRTAGNNGPQGMAEINDGKYDTSSGGKGVMGGKYDVIISGFTDKPNFNDESVIVKPLFPENKRKAELPNATTTLDFNLP